MPKEQLCYLDHLTTLSPTANMDLMQRSFPHLLPLYCSDMSAAHLSQVNICCLPPWYALLSKWSSIGNSIFLSVYVSEREIAKESRGFLHQRDKPIEICGHLYQNNNHEAVTAPYNQTS